MSRIVHFVVGVDLDEGVPFIDDETFTARFNKDEKVWDTEKNEWREEDYETEYLPALEILNTVALARE